MAQIPGNPKLESRNCPETVPGGVLGLWGLITPDCKLGSRRSLNQSCIPRRDLSKGISHSPFGGWENIDSRLLVVGSQTASLTPDPSFAHNLGDRCPNGRCEAIFDIYASRPFQWHQEHPNVRCFGSCSRALNIRESRRTPNPQLFQVLGFTPTLGQVRIATSNMMSWSFFLAFFHFLIPCNVQFFCTNIFKITLHEIEKCSLFDIWFFWVLTYHNMQKHCENPS
jgi:hypothetical protein